MTRRAKGEGSWRARPDGRVEYRLAGRSYYGATKGEALRKARAAADRAKALVDRHTRVADYLTRWLETDVIEQVRPSTMRVYRAAVGRVVEHLGHLPLADVTADDLRRLLADLGSPYLARQARIVLRLALARAVTLGLLAQSACDQVASPRLPHVPLRVWTVAEQAAFLAASRTHYHYPLWVLALHTGMRLGELLALTWRDVDLDGATLVVQASVDRSGLRSPPKSAAGYRRIDLAHELVELLAALPRQSDLVFCRPDGRPLDSGAMRKAYYRAVARAGVPRIRFHDLRHTMASTWLAAGVHPKVVSERLGHANIQVTLTTYAHVMPGQQAAAASTMAQVMLGRPADGQDGVGAPFDRLNG